MKLRSFGESYEMDAPSLVVKFLPVPSTEWGGNVSILCKESGLEADLCYYRSHHFLGFGSSARAVKGKIFNSKTLMTIYEIYGRWDRSTSNPPFSFFLLPLSSSSFFFLLPFFIFFFLFFLFFRRLHAFSELLRWLPCGRIGR